MEAQKTSKLGKLIHPNCLLGVMIACSITLVSFEWKFQYADYAHDPFEYEIEGGIVEIPHTFQKEDIQKPVQEKITFNDQIFKKVDDKTKIDDDKDPFDDFEDPDGDDLFSDGDWWNDEEPKEENIPWDMVEKMPFIKGCDFEDDEKKKACTLRKIYGSLGDNLDYPKSMKEQGMEGNRRDNDHAGRGRKSAQKDKQCEPRIVVHKRQFQHVEVCRDGAG